MNLILLDQEEAAQTAEDGGVILLKADDRRTRHILTVLKPEAGATVRIGVLGGGIGRATVEILDGGSVKLSLALGQPQIDRLPPPAQTPHLELLLAMPRPKVMMRMWSALAQLGVRRVILTNACRVEKPYFSSQATDPTKYMMELREGLEQAACTRLPDVRIEMRLKPFVEDVLDELCPSNVQRLLCHPGDCGVRIAQAVAAARLESQASRERGVLLAVGPEGGWVDFELEMFRKHRFEQVTLGPRILTTEVALVSLVSLTMDALGTSSTS